MNNLTRMLTVAIIGLTCPLGAQEETPTRPVWADSLRPGGGPSFGSPPSTYTGEQPVTQWCLGTSDWWSVSEPRLRQVLSDTSALGTTWRKILGNAASFAPGDSMRLVTDEARCHNAAQLIHRGLLGWPEGAPPVVMADLPDGSTVAWPAATHFGEFGAIVRFNVARQIVAVAFW